MNYILIISAAICSVLLGCKSQPADTQSAELTRVNSSVSVRPNIKDCGAMPPLRDRTKLIENLRTKGLITADMDQVQIDTVVSDYLTKRQNAFKKCHKPTSNTGKS